MGPFCNIAGIVPLIRPAGYGKARIMGPLRIFSRLFANDGDNAYHVYGAVVAQARRPYFYSELGVPDTLDGRFDMILLHLALVLQRLKEGREEKGLSQDVVDVMFADLDRNLREMGVGDLSVAKKIKPMAAAFSGRTDAYCRAIAEGALDDLAAAIARNVFPDDDGIPAAALQLADYALDASRRLSRQGLSALCAGQLDFPDPEEAGGL
jgi:cytochrome b pre-mRNA-processing protein 3